MHFFLGKDNTKLLSQKRRLNFLLFWGLFFEKKNHSCHLLWLHNFIFFFFFFFLLFSTILGKLKLKKKSFALLFG